jgi:hypothetical protein
VPIVMISMAMSLFSRGMNFFNFGRRFIKGV